MYDGPAGLAVRTSLASIASQSSTVSDADIALLRARICAVVIELKSMGWPVERIIVRLKEVASEVGLRPTRKELLTPVEAQRRDTLWANTIRVCIEQYYGE